MKKFKKVIFPPTLTRKVVLRDDKKWREAAKKVQEEKDRLLARKGKLTKIENDENEHGIKGTCQLMRLSYVDIVKVSPPEPMHSQFLGMFTILFEYHKWY